MQCRGYALQSAGRSRRGQSPRWHSSITGITAVVLLCMHSSRASSASAGLVYGCFAFPGRRLGLWLPECPNVGVCAAAIKREGSRSALPRLQLHASASGVLIVSLTTGNCLSCVSSMVRTGSVCLVVLALFQTCIPFKLGSKWLGYKVRTRTHPALRTS